MSDDRLLSVRGDLHIPPRPPLPPTPPTGAAVSRAAEPHLPPGWTIVRAAPPAPATPSPFARLRTRVQDAGGFAALRRDPRAWLAAYLLVLTAIAFWPVPVDSAAGPLLRLVTRIVPVLTYHRIEFGANVLLFVPLGLLLALILSRRRYLVVPIAVIATVMIEGGQGILLGARTASVLDVIANTAGACIGLVVAELVTWRRDRVAQSE